MYLHVYLLNPAANSKPVQRVSHGLHLRKISSTCKKSERTKALLNEAKSKKIVRIQNSSSRGGGLTLFSAFCNSQDLVLTVVGVLIYGRSNLHHHRLNPRHLRSSTAGQAHRLLICRPAPHRHRRIQF